MIWKILEIEKTKDEELIKKAYREKLRYVNPEDDQEGFKELRRAYEEALDYASGVDEDLLNAEDQRIDLDRKKNEVDLWVDKVDSIYRDVKTRVNEEKWKILLNDPICDNLDTELEAAEKLLVYFMSHSYMPQNIWQLVDKRFGYVENFDQLKEKFPENYLEYVKWQINRPSFIDFELFEGKTDSDVDAYINKLYEVKNVAEDGDLIRIKQLINELKRFDVIHPFTQVEEARCLLLEAEQILKKADAEISKEQITKRRKLLTEALSIMEDLDFEYSDNPYIERIYAETLIENEEIDKARDVFDSLLEENPENYSAMLGKAKCVFLSGNAEEAKEQIEDILEERVQDAESLSLLEKVNKVLVEKYEAQLENKYEREICFKLGWCYYQQKKFDKGIELLDQMERAEDYDYVNLRCRLYLANENYDKARPFAELWLKLIEGSEDDGTKEMQKRKNRLSLAHFSIGVCHWEDTYKKAGEDEKTSVFSKVVFYIKKAIEEETNLMVKMSYMEQLARFYLEANNYTGCIDVCDEIIGMDRGFFPAYVHRQKAHYELRNAKEVIDDYFNCIEIYPQYAKPYILAADVFFTFGQYDDMEEVIQAAKGAGVESDSLELYHIRFNYYSRKVTKEHLLEVLSDLEALRDKVQNRNEETDIEDLADLEKEYAILHIDMDDIDKTLRIIDDFLRKDPDNTKMLLLKVDVLLNKAKRYEEGLKICQRLVELKPDVPYIANKLASCYEWLEDYDKAIESYEKVLKLDECYEDAIRRLMYIYSYLSNRFNDLNKCRKGVEYATRLIKITHSAEGYVERGNLYIDLYELEKAVEDCKKAIELDSEAYYAYNNLGCALLKLRRVDEAIEPLKQAIIMSPNKDHLPYLNLAECYVLQQSYGKAIETYNEVLRLRPNAQFRIRKDIAKIYVLNKEYNKAIEIYQELVNKVYAEIKKAGFLKRLQKEPSEDEKELMLLYCSIADIYRQAGDEKKAELYYKKIYPGLRKNFKHINADVAEKVAEYYRDSGRLENALWIMEHAMNGNLASYEVNTWDEKHLYFTYTTILFELGRKKEAKEAADFFIAELLKKHGGEEKLLADLRYRPMHLYDIGIMYVCAGDLEKGRYYLGQIKQCNLCVTCETCDCFEYYFGMGLIAELEDCKDEAIQLYQRAVKMKGDYLCAKRHLESLTSNKL